MEENETALNHIFVSFMSAGSVFFPDSYLLAFLLHTVSLQPDYDLLLYFCKYILFKILIVLNCVQAD